MYTVCENARDYRDEARIARGLEMAARQDVLGIDPQDALVENLDRLGALLADQVCQEYRRLDARLKAAGYRWPFPCLVDRDGNRVNARLRETRYGPAWGVMDDQGRVVRWISHLPEKPIDPKPFWTEEQKQRDPLAWQAVFEHFQTIRQRWERRVQRWQEKHQVELSTELAPARAKLRDRRIQIVRVYNM